MLRLFRQVSLHQLRSNAARTALVVGGIATGVALMVAIAIINRSVLDDFRRTLELIAMATMSATPVAMPPITSAVRAALLRS